MKTVFLYAGQGSQRIGMGRDIAQQFPSYQKTIEKLPHSDELQQMMYSGTEQALAQTAHTQPCMAAFAAGVTAVLREAGLVPWATCGLSLGEYGALHAAGAFDAASYVELLCLRGRLMAEAAGDSPFAMRAVLNLAAERVEQLCGAADGFAQVVIYSCPGQCVICGAPPAVEQVEQMATAEGAHCKRMAVGGPFHTHLMAGAAAQFGAQLAKFTFAPLQCKFVSNDTGDYAADEAQIKQGLMRQIKSSVRFDRSLRRLLADGADCFVGIGPGRALASYAEKTAAAMGKTVRLYPIDTAEQLKVVVAAARQRIFSGE